MKEFERLIKKWEKAKQKFMKLGKEALDFDDKNEFYAHAGSFDTCIKDLKRVLKKK